MLELSKIGFNVETGPLEDAAKKIEALGTAAVNLSTKLKGLDTTSAKLALAQEKVNLATEKTATQAAKTAAIVEKTETVKQKSIKKTTEATKEATAAHSGFVEGIERKRNLISEGWTRGESTILKTAEAIGVAGNEMERLKGLLRDIGGLASNPFDSTLGSLRSIQKEFDGLVLRSKLVDQGIELTTTQLKQFARIAAEASVAVKKMGMDPTEGAGLEMYNKLLKDSQDEYLKVAVASKTLLDGEKLLAKQHRDTASAKSFLIKEDERMVHIMEQMNTGTLRSVSISEKAAVATANYARALKTAGVNGTEAKDRLAKYSAAQQLAAEKEEQRAAANLARALQPQATDVLVSLWSGQSPLTVMLQQGGQVVDLFKLSGLEANKLGNTMKAAFAGMLPSIMAVGSAVGGLLVDGVKASIAGISNLVAKTLLLDKATDLMRKKIIESSADFDTATKNVARFDAALSVISKGFAVLVLTSIAALIGLAAGLVQVMKENDNLAKSLALSGGALSVSQSKALGYTKALTEMGMTTGTATQAIIEMAKAGNIGSESILMIGESAAQMEKWAGVAIEDTVKQFSKLKEKPVEALLEVAKATGMVAPEILKLVIELDRQGKSSEAAAEAMKAYAKVTKSQVESMKENYTSFGSFMITLGSSIKTFFSDIFKSVLLVTDPVVVAEQQLQKVNERIQEVKKNLAFNAKFGITPDKSLLNSLQAEADNISEVLKLKKRSNTEQEKTTEINYENAKAQEYLNGLREKNMPAEVKAQNDLNELLEKRKSLLDKGMLSDPKDLKIMEDAIKKQQKVIDDANKRDKPKVSKEQKELDNYGKKIAERVKDLGIEITGVAEELTKADKLLLDLVDDETWKKLTPELQEHYRLKLLFISSQEKAIAEQKKENKLNEDLTKIHNENREFIAKSSNESAKITDGYELQLSLLGKTVEEQEKLTKAAALRAKVAEVEFKFSEQLAKNQEKYSKKINDANGDQSAIFKIIEEENKERSALDQERLKALGVLYKGVAVQASVDYYNEMQKVASELAGVISTALFEGGQAGTKRLRDYIVGTFRKKIEVWLEANIMGAITGVNSVGGGSSSVGGIAGMAQGISTAVGLVSTFGSSVASGLGATLSGSMGTAISSGLANIGAGTSSAIASGLGSIAGALAPYALAAVALYSLFREKEYVKGTGSANLAFDAAGNTTQKNTFTKDFEIQTKEADAFVETMKSSYASLARTLGIDSKGGAFSYGSNNSDGGKFSVGANVGSGSYFKTDIKASPEALQLEASRAVFAALKGSDLPAYLTKLFSSVVAETASGAEIEGVLKYASTLKSVRDTLTETRTPLEVFKDNLNKAFVVLGTNAESFKTDFVAAIDKGIGPDALASWMAAGDAMAALTEEADKLAETNKGLQDRLDVLMGVQTERTLELRDATDESTKTLLKQIYAQEDLRDAAEAAKDAVKEVSLNLDEWMKWDKAGVSNAEQYAAVQKIEDIRKEAADNYFNAQKAVTEAQQNLVSALQDTVKGFKDFLGTLDNAEGPTGRLDIARKNFEDISARARTGDTEAIGQLTTSGKTFLDLSKSYSATIQDYRRDEAKVRNVLNEGIKAAEVQLGTLPKELQKSTDPLKAAFDALTAANLAETEARHTAIAVQANLSRSEMSLMDRYLEQVRLLPNGGQAEEYTKAVTELTGFLSLFGLSIGLVDGKQVLLNTATGEVVNYMAALGLTYKEVDGKQVIVRDSSKVLSDTLNVLGETFGLVDGKFILLKNKSDTVTSVMNGLGTTVVNADGSTKTLITSTDKTVIVLDTLGMTIKSVDGKFVLVDTALDKLNASIPTGIEIPDIAGFYTGVQTGMSAALTLAETSATAAAKLLADMQSVVTVPSITTLLGSKGLSMTGDTVTKDWDGALSTFKASEVAAGLNEYGNAYGVDAATARAIELGATNAILEQLRKYSEGLPQFDGGTNYVTQDMDVRVHKGEAIIPAAFNSNLMSGSPMMEGLLNAIAIKLDTMQKVNSNENNAVISNTGRILTKLDRLSPNGDAFDVNVIKTV